MKTEQTGFSDEKPLLIKQEESASDISIEQYSDEPLCIEMNQFKIDIDPQIGNLTAMEQKKAT